MLIKCCCFCCFPCRGSEPPGRRRASAPSCSRRPSCCTRCPRCPTATRWWPWLRTNGVNTHGAAAKVMNFDRLGKKVHPGTFGKVKVG